MKLQPKIKLIDRVRQTIRLKNYTYSTEKAYVYWIKRFILFHNKRHPKTMGCPEIETFLSYLAVERNVAASTQNQALCALLFLYRDVLGVELDSPIVSVRAKRPKRLPTVLTKPEVQLLISSMSGKHQLMAKLLYGSGLRLTLAPHKHAAQVQVWSVFDCASRISISINTRSSFVMERGSRIALPSCPTLQCRVCTAIFAASSCFMKTILPTDSVEYPFLTRWRLNIPVRNLSGSGSISSLPKTYPGIHAAAI